MIDSSVKRDVPEWKKRLSVVNYTDVFLRECVESIKRAFAEREFCRADYAKAFKINSHTAESRLSALLAKGLVFRRRALHARSNCKFYLYSVIDTKKGDESKETVYKERLARLYSLVQNRPFYVCEALKILSTCETTVYLVLRFGIAQGLVKRLGGIFSGAYQFQRPLCFQLEKSRC